jgi:hypothetical protein
MKTHRIPRVAVALGAALGVLFACGGQIEIGAGKDPLTGDPCAPSECGANTLTCPSGSPTDVLCSRYQGGACAWSGKCPGDCNPSKCDNMQGACAYGTPTNLRCVPSPFAGQGSAPPDMCEIKFDCQGTQLDASPNVGPTNDASVCSMDKCQNQGFGCATGPATNLRCVPDPNAGVGSDPIGHCILEGDCPPESADATAPGFDASTSADVSVD